MNEYDVVVIGGGAAGSSAALVLLRARRSVLVIDAGTPRNAPAATMHGFISRDGTNPRDLLADGRAELQHYGGLIIDDTVLDITPGFDVCTKRTHFRARRIVVATGLRDELPDIPGIRERWGRDVLHCPYCHGYEVRDKALGVIGDSPEAVQHAQLIRQWSPDVTFFSHTYELTAIQRTQLTARNIRIIEEPIARIAIRENELHGIEMSDGTLIAEDAVFVRPRLVPNSNLLTDLGCELNEDGWPHCDATGQTSVAGVWAAGNAADPRAQVITAAGHGSAAAIALNASLVDEDVALASMSGRV